MHSDILSIGTKIECVVLRSLVEKQVSLSSNIEAMHYSIPTPQILGNCRSNSEEGRSEWYNPPQISMSNTVLQRNVVVNQAIYAAGLFDRIEPINGAQESCNLLKTAGYR